MQYLKQSTAVTVQIGPFLDETDGKTAETGLAISQADVRLSKNGAAFAAKNDASAAAHDEQGWYRVPLDATDTGTLGRLIVAVHESGALPVRREYHVLTPLVYDSLAANDDFLRVDAIQISGDTTAANNLEAYCDGTTPMPANVTQIEGGDPTDALAAAALGAGAISFTYTLTSDVDSSAIVGARVWATSDEAGDHVLASGTTDGSGQVTFYLDAGTVYVWRQKAGWNFDNPDQETVA